MPGVNLFDLAAKISVDNKDVDRSLTDTQKKVKDLEKQFKQAEQAAKKTSQSLTSDFKGALSEVSSSASFLFGAAGPLTIGAAGLVALGGGLAALAKSAAEFSGNLFDMGEKINFSAETLSALKVAAETSGSSIEVITAALGIFDRNLEESQNGNKQLAATFKALHIDVTNNEQALRDAFTALGKVQSGSQQTALAMQLFGRAGKDVVGVLKQAGGDLDSWIAQMRELGLVVTPQAAREADAFNDQLAILQDQIEAAGRQIGTVLLPQVKEAAVSMSDWLTKNSGNIAEFAREVGKATDAVTTLIGNIIRYNPLTWVVKIVYQLGGLAGQQEFDKINQVSGAAGTFDVPSGVNPEDAYAMAAVQAGLDPESQRLKALSRGGRMNIPHGSSKAQKKDPGLTLLRQLEEQFRSLTPQTELEKIQHKLLNEEYAKTPDPLKKIIEITAIDIDMRKKALELTRERIATGQAEREEFQKMVDLVRAAGEQGVAGFVRPRSVADLFMKGASGEEDSTLGAGGKFDIVAQQRAKLDALKEKAREIASDVTGILSDSIHAGFEGGIVAGLVAFEKGILRMIESAALSALEKRLAQVFENIFTGGGSGGGGGFWKTLIGLGGAVLGGAVGGGFTKGGAGGVVLGKAAGGGFIPGGAPFIVGEQGPELFVPSSSGNVIPNNQLGGNMVVNFYVQHPAQLGSRETQAQVARKMMRIQQKRALTG